jgi:hypothetical protein
MKSLLHLAASISMALALGAVDLGQQYTQVNLVSNTSGVAPITEPQNQEL